MSYLDRTKNIRKFGGAIYYVSNRFGSDANGGTEPISAFKTIGKAISMLVEGDAINVRAGDYTEVGLDLNVSDCELWFEIGAVLSPASGTGLVISGDYCSTTGRHQINAVAGEIGKLVTGNGCHMEHGRILGGSKGLSVTGSGFTAENYACGNQTDKAFDLQGGQIRLLKCSTVGIGSSYGFFINNLSAIGVLDGCTSVGHQVSGFFISSGSKNWSVVGCYTGAVDGRWKDEDNDSSNVWDIKYDSSKYKRNTFIGDGAGSVNLFKITGTVNIYGLHADVETNLAADVGDVKYELINGATVLDVTDVVASASAPAGSFFAKEKKSADALTLYGSGGVQLIQETNLKKAVFAINAAGAADTFLRFTWSGNAASGALHHHIDWEPLSDNGFVEIVA